MNFCIIIPAHNEEEVIEKCLDSLINQSYPANEIIVVDDHSTDQTAQIVSKFTQVNPSIKLLHNTSSEAHQPGEKIINAFYKGVENIEYAYQVICKFDADLIFPPNYLSELKANFEANSKLGMLAGFCYIENEHGQWVKEKLTNDEHIRGPLKAYRKQCFEDIGGLIKAMGWDTLDELLARFQAWETKTLPQLHVKHLKPTGQRYSKELAKRFGSALYQMDYGLVLSFLSLLKIALLKKKLSFLIQGLTSYFKTIYKRPQKLVTKEEGRFIRNYRWKMIKIKIFKSHE